MKTRKQPANNLFLQRNYAGFHGWFVSQQRRNGSADHHLNLYLWQPLSTYRQNLGLPAQVGLVATLQVGTTMLSANSAALTLPYLSITGATSQHQMYSSSVQHDRHANTCSPVVSAQGALPKETCPITLKFQLSQASNSNCAKGFFPRPHVISLN